jgi:indolepyruvate ferredoxin oxidoreductase alpha subunit
MTERILTGAQALAYGAIEADVRVVTGHPGSPCTEVLENILRLSEGEANRHIEWSSNEKVAFEIALGTSIGGDRALLCLKSVGMNIAIDPIMTANLTGVNGGLVILLGDDPGAVLSQNEQDTRLLADFLELPLMEPSSPQEGKEMLLAAFDISEEFQTAVIVRFIRSFSKSMGPVKLADKRISREPKGFIRGRNRWVSTTFNVFENHRKLHDKLERLKGRFASSPFNRVIGTGDQHIIAAGFAYNKLKELLGSEISGSGKLSVLKLGTIYPPPEEVMVNFLRGAKAVLVLEDNEPYIEDKVKTIAHDAQIDVEVMGKGSGHAPREGELRGEDIARALSDLGIIERAMARVSSEEGGDRFETQRSFCEGCPYRPTFQALAQVIEELGEETAIIAEPGCAVRLNAPPFEMLDIKHSMGSAIGIASGLAWSRANVKPIAVCGDSSFFHTGVNGLMNLVANRVNIFILVLENSVAAMSGYQPHPGTGWNLKGRETPSVDIAEIARACRVPFVVVLDPDDAEGMRSAFRKGLSSDELSVVIVRKPCPRLLSVSRSEPISASPVSP